MRFSLAAFLLLYLLLLIPANLTAQNPAGKSDNSAIKKLFDDFQNFYSPRIGVQFAVALGVGAIMANTPIDGDIQHWYQDNLRSRRSNQFARYVKPVGNGRITVPVYFGAFLLGKMSDRMKPVGKWGEYSIRAILVGAPPLLFFQKALGSSRPYEDNSHWHFFSDDNGVSGHSFMGAVPFIAAAKLFGHKLLKSFCYTTSLFCGFSRINDHKHYFSQVMLGWCLAYLAVGSVHHTSSDKFDVSVSPLKDGIIINMKFHIQE